MLVNHDTNVLPAASGCLAAESDLNALCERRKYDALETSYVARRLERVTVSRHCDRYFFVDPVNGAVLVASG